MLAEAASNGKEGIVSWLPEGGAFKVHQVPLFVTDILPLYFKQTKYKSFQRQLNLWGFERLTSGPDKGAYYHTHFLRDDPELCKNLTRQRAKKASPSKAAHRTILVPSSVASTNKNKDGSFPLAAALMPRQVSESSLESFGELFRELDTTSIEDPKAAMMNSSLDLAEFEGFTFHLLEQERYEELNMEFKFSESGGSSSAGSNTALPSSQQSISQVSVSSQEEEDSSVQTLLHELETGTFGTPKTSFDGPSLMGGDASAAPLLAV
ncbi:MAG: hypothetical protein SGARI_000795 [Bacillariaceae sp.]